MKFLTLNAGPVKTLATLAAVGLFTILGTSCKSTTAGGSGEYPQYAQDGTYNPYPGSSGQTTPQQYQTYQAPQQYQQYTPPQQPQQTYTPPPEPSYTPPSSQGSGGGGGGYTVKRGDTLYRIALNNGVTVSRLKSANGLTNDIIKPGQVLTIP